MQSGLLVISIAEAGANPLLLANDLDAYQPFLNYWCPYMWRPGRRFLPWNNQPDYPFVHRSSQRGQCGQLL